MTRSKIDRTACPIVFIDDAHTFGGAQIAMAWGIRVLLRNTDEKIICICTARTEQAVRNVTGEDPRLEFIRCPAALAGNFVSFPLRLLPFLSIIRRLRHQGVKMWWLNLSGIEFCLAPQMILKALGEPTRAWLHNTERFAFFNSRGSSMRRAISRVRDAIADRWLFGIYTWVIAPSRSTATEMMARIRGKRPSFGHLYYPTIGEQPTQPPSSGNLKDSSKSGTISLWMIGRVEYGHKNNLAALQAFELLSHAGRDVTLTVIGDGPDMEDFKSKVASSAFASNISLLGWQTSPWETVPQHAMVFISSFYESMSLVAREAMIRGISLVASPIPVFREWIPAPLVADDLRAESFAEKILEVSSISREDLLELYDKALARFSDSIFKESFLAYTEAK